VDIGQLEVGGPLQGVVLLVVDHLLC
jgi:hypothetical protein